MKRPVRTKEEMQKALKIIRSENPSYKLNRLKGKRPDLADRVIAGELSATAAYIEAGFVERKVTVTKTPEGFAKYISRYFNDEEIEIIFNLVKGQKR